MKRLRWKTVAKTGEAYHVARAHMRGRRPCALHAHDFAEVFWVESGQGLHVINGQQLPLTPGNLVTIRPADCHGFRCTDAAGFTLVNVAFSRDTLAFLRGRYFGGERRFFWAATPQPFGVTLGPARLRWLRGWAGHLDRAPRTRLEGERFLIELLHELASAPAAAEGDPEWLARALEGIRQPAQFRGGTRALARLAGRTPQHVNRALKLRHGITATDVVNRARLEHAAMQLRMSTEKIIVVALESGFQNLGHFYQVFRREFGTTPRLYRLRHHTVVR
ncbi:MAG: AraC family transcriptional regulator [Verrucomicrobia bacterium]|nr:AraC family transcriptional regulator [Verrucomicrobiota bacterium]